MTYYEELGVGAAASVEEIRHAYRNVVRLVHPDHCTDDETRRLADLQMKRLNSMLAVLADGPQRAKYDASILSAPPLPDVRRRLQVAAALAVLLLVAIAAAWPRRQAESKPLPIPPPSKAAHLPKKQSYRQPPKARQTVPSRAPQRVLPQPLPAPAPAPAEPPAIAVLQPAAAMLSLAEPARPTLLSGRWLFASSPAMKHSGYPPEYVELRLTENAGVLHGHYRARYLVNDRAVSPNVAFRFDGYTGPDGGTLHWDGLGGAKGEVTLRLLPGGNLEVDWVARQLGQEQALISGTATLVRKIE